MGTKVRIGFESGRHQIIVGRIAPPHPRSTNRYDSNQAHHALPPLNLVGFSSPKKFITFIRAVQIGYTEPERTLAASASKRGHLAVNQGKDHFDDHFETSLLACVFFEPIKA